MGNERIVLSKGQQAALNSITDFINNSDERVFILTGYAGSGKSTLTRRIIKVLFEKEANFFLVASTGRAAKVIRDITNVQEVKTVHSLIYDYNGFNKDLDEVVERRGKNEVDDTGQLFLCFELSSADYEDGKGQNFYIVDEASMISDEKDRNPTQAMFGTGRLLNDLLQYDKTGKFIFIGDPCQLPPVNQSYSPALSAEYFKQTFAIDAKCAMLTEVMRQKDGNDIVLASKRIRDLYQNPQPWKWAKFPLRGYKNIHLLHSQAELIEKYIDRYRRFGMNDCTYIGLSNRQCDTVTRIIRPALGLTQPTVSVGDLMLVTQNNLVSGLMNGDIVKVTDVMVKERRAGLTFLKVSVQETITGQEHSQLMIADIVYSNQTNLTQTQQKELFIDFYIRMKKKGIKYGTKKFNDEMRQDQYLNALRSVYGFALTCHKTQGGEWDNVFLDMPRNIGVMQKPYVYQWVYTAMTRAKKNLYIVDDFYIE